MCIEQTMLNEFHTLMESVDKRDATLVIMIENEVDDSKITKVLTKINDELIQRNLYSCYLLWKVWKGGTLPMINEVLNEFNTLMEAVDNAVDNVSRNKESANEDDKKILRQLNRCYMEWKIPQISGKKVYTDK